MSDHLITLKSFLVGDVNYISRADIGKQVFLASQSLLLFLFLYHVFNVMLETARLVKGRNEFGINVIRIIPFWLSRFAMFVVWSFSGDPLLVVGSLIEDGPFGSVSDDYSLLQVQSK